MTFLKVPGFAEVLRSGVVMRQNKDSKIVKKYLGIGWLWADDGRGSKGRV